MGSTSSFKYSVTFLFSLSFLASRGRQAKDKCVFLLYLQVISASNSKGEAAAAAAGSSKAASHGLHMEFTTKVCAWSCVSSTLVSTEALRGDRDPGIHCFVIDESAVEFHSL